MNRHRITAMAALQYVKRSDVHEVDESLLHDIIEDEVSLSEDDEEEVKAFVEDAQTRFRSLSRNDFLDIWRDLKDQYSDHNTLKREFSKAIRNSEKFQNFIDAYMGGRENMVYKFRDIRTKSNYPEKKALRSIARLSAKSFKKEKLEESRSNLRDTLPEELRQWVPKKMVVEVDEDGMIERISNRFAQKRETIRKKIVNMKIILRNYNHIVEEVKQDLKSSDETTRLAALVTSIMMETGIRPGSAGNWTTETVDGDEIEVATFGAVTLQKEHVDFIRDDFAELEFKGKKGTINFAEVSDKAILSVLRQYVDDARDRNSDFIFVTKSGERFTYKDLGDYLDDRWSYISPTDFRKLKATETVLESLHESQKDLYMRINQFVDEEVDNLKEKVAEEVSATIESALKEAQDALSHKKLRTTIKDYTNPEVVLRFLSRGQIEDNIEDAIMTNERHLEFDPWTFIERAEKQSSRQKLAKEETLEDILRNLEKDMDTISDIDTL